MPIQKVGASFRCGDYGVHPIDQEIQGFAGTFARSRRKDQTPLLPKQIPQQNSDDHVDVSSGMPNPEFRVGRLGEAFRRNAGKLDCFAQIKFARVDQTDVEIAALYWKQCSDCR